MVLEMKPLPSWEDLPPESQERISIIMGWGRDKYEEERERAVMYQRVQEQARKDMERMWHVPTLEERAGALAMARLLTEIESAKGRTVLISTHQEHYRRAFFDITRAEEVLAETEAAMKAAAEEQS